MKRADLNGIITELGELKLYNIAELAELKKKNKGSKVIMTIFVDESKSVELMRNYYNYVAVPRVRDALFELGNAYSDEKTSNFLQQISPTCETLRLSEFKKENWVTFLNEVRDFSKSELNLILQDINSL